MPPRSAPYCAPCTRRPGRSGRLRTRYGSPGTAGTIGGPARVIGHCDVAPWNIVARDGLPVAFIDWETAGPVDPIVELAQLSWLNAKLHDDIVAGIEHLTPLADRASNSPPSPTPTGSPPGSDAAC